MEDNKILSDNTKMASEPRDYVFQIEKQYYKKKGDDDVKESLTIKLSFMGGSVLARPLSKNYGALCRFADSHPQLVIERNDKAHPVEFDSNN